METIKFQAWCPNDNIMLDWSTLRQTAFNYGDCHLFYTAFNNPNYILRQYIVVQDKNSKEIYTGDIIKTINGGYGMIVFKAPFFEVTVSETQSSSYTKEWLEASEVVGNIYQNPDFFLTTPLTDNQTK